MINHPISIQDLVNGFKKIGLEKSMNLMVHSSLSKIGWVIGGANAVITALFEIIGNKGTIVMPSATPDCLHPEDWDKKINPDWIPKIIENLPVFELNTTPTTMGAVPEAFRNWPNTVRSNHPISSVCANGKIAEEIVEHHRLEISEGINTPYEKLYKNSFNILLLGVGFNRCTMLHFAESKSDHKRITYSRYPIVKNGKKEWVSVKDMGNDNSTYFPIIGKQYMDKNGVLTKKIGNADSILVDVKSLVDFGTGYFNKKMKTAYNKG